jgi:DNA-3-methyladenine glycosylase II
MTQIPVPQPYDFERSTERFRVYGRDLATVWHEGGLHRVVEGHEVRVEPSQGGVRMNPDGEHERRHVEYLLGLPFDLEGFWSWARGERVLALLEQPVAGYRPPLQPDPWEALVTSITAQQVSLQSAFAIRSRFVVELGERHGIAWSFPARERVAAAREGELVAVGFSRRKAEYVIGLARSDLDLDSLSGLPDDDVVATLTSLRGLGRWSADWYLARALARPDAWPAGDLGVRKAVSYFYGDGGMLSETEVRSVGEQFGPWRNLAAHMLLMGLRVAG